MKHFGQINEGLDLVTKDYVDKRTDGYNVKNTIVGLPVNKRNVIVTIPSGQKQQELSLYENLKTGGELFVYIKSESDDFSVLIPKDLGGYLVSYCGNCDSTLASYYVIPLNYFYEKKGEEEIIRRTTVTLHIFFDGSMYYIDRFLVYVNNL